MDSEEYIDNENWTDMREGATGTVFAKLDSVSFDNCAITVTFTDWQQMLIDCPDGGAIAMFTEEPSNRPGKGNALRADSRGLRAKAIGDGGWLKPLIPLNSHVMVRVRRTEDGLKGLAIWTIGGTPIPLTSSK